MFHPSHFVFFSYVQLYLHFYVGLDIRHLLSFFGEREYYYSKLSRR